MYRWNALLLSAAIAASTVAVAQAPQLTQPKVAPQITSRIVSLQAIPANRPTLRQFVGILQAAGRDPAALKRLVEATSAPLKVQRICHVFGGYSSRVTCVSAADMVGSMPLSPADRTLVNMGLNDLWEKAGGAPGGGDINACGGRDIRSVTNITVGPGGGTTGLSGALGGGAAPGGAKAGGVATQMLTGGAATSKLSACRSAQLGGMAAGLGFRHVPGSPGYRAAVAQAQTFLGGIGASCRESGNSLVADDGDASAGGQPAASTGGQSSASTVSGALATVAGATTDLIGAMSAAADILNGCTDAAKCAVNAAGAAIGLVADANDLVGNEGGFADKVKGADTLMDLVGGAMALGEAAAAGAGAVAAADAVLPGLAVFAMGTTIGTPIGNAVAKVMDPVYVRAADWINGVNDTGAPAASGRKSPSTPIAGGGVGRPAEGARSCEAIAQRAAAFNSYCSQPGNDWQSYDCMSFVARFNGCADPGLVQPVPGEDFQCSGRRSEQEKRQTACEQQERLRGMLSSTVPGTASISRCAQLGSAALDLQQRLQQRICTQVRTGDDGGLGGGMCAGPAGTSRTSGNRAPAP